MAEPTDPRERARRRGGRLALGVYYSLVVVVIVGATAQITVQVFRRADSPPVDCRVGLRSMLRAVDAAKAAAATGELSPEASLARFRAALSPAWDDRDRVERACREPHDRKLEEAFDTVERLRFAEENVIRRDARDLAPLRRKVLELEATTLK